MKDFTAEDNKIYPVSDDCDLNNQVVVRNLNATVRALEGEDPDEVFGEQVPIDTLKFTDWSPDTCNCRVRFMWRRDHAEDIREHHPHRALDKCEHHGHHDTHHDHFHAVTAENRSKNDAIAKAAKHHDKSEREFAWEFDSKRRVKISHPELGDIDLKKIK